jgi:hypothetical protein
MMIAEVCDEPQRLTQRVVADEETASDSVIVNASRAGRLCKPHQGAFKASEYLACLQV